MRNELTERLTMLMQKLPSNDVRNELIIILNDYEITKRETALTLYKEDENMLLLRRFLIAKTVKGCSGRTIQFYQIQVRKILSEIGKPVAEITADDIRLYLALRERRDNVSKTTCDNELRCLRSFYNWMHAEEIISKNPVAKIEKIRAKKIKRKAFTEIEVEKIREQCQDARDVAIIEILLSTGCRVSELVNIKISDIRDGELIVHGKGNKERMVYLNAKAQIAIAKYLSERKDTNPYLFARLQNVKSMIKKGVSRSDMLSSWKLTSNVLPNGNLDLGTVEEKIRKMGRQCGVEAYPHKFRRTCATFALRRGMPIEQVSKMLGHEQISTTQIYLDLSDEDLKIAHRKYVV